MRENRDAGIFGAVTAIGAMVTAGFSWMPVLLGWSLSTLMLLILPSAGKIQGKTAAWVVLLGSVGVLAAAALGAEDAFPEDSTFPFLSAALLLLLWRAMAGERRTPGDVANLLGMILLPVLTVVVLFGVEDVQWGENLPAICPWNQVLISAAAVSPWWCLRRGPRTRRMWGWYGASAAVCLGFSLLTWGILGHGLARQAAFPLYRTVQTIRILGVLQRFEALFAAAVLMGAFGLMLLTSERTAEALDILLHGTARKWKSGAVLLAAFLIEWGLWGMADNAAVLEPIFWTAILILALWVVVCKKSGNSAKKA